MSQEIVVTLSKDINKELVFSKNKIAVFFPIKLECENPKYCVTLYSVEYGLFNYSDLVFGKDMFEFNHKGISYIITNNKVSIYNDENLDNRNPSLTDNIKEYFISSDDKTFRYKNLILQMKGGVFTSKEINIDQNILYYDFNSADSTDYGICKYSILDLVSYKGDNNIVTIFDSDKDEDIQFSYNSEGIMVNTKDSELSAIIENNSVKLKKVTTKTLIF